MMSMTSPSFITEDKGNDEEEMQMETRDAKLSSPVTGVAAAAPAPPHTSWWSMLRQEIKREERWSWLPRPSRYQLVNFKGQDNDVPSTAFVVFRAGVLLYWSAWVSLSVVGTSKCVHLPAPLYEYLEYGVLWLIYATNWTAMLLWVHLAMAFVAASMVATLDRRCDSAARWVGLVAWVVRDTVAPAAVMVTLLYWLLLFPAFGYTSFVDVHLHLVNALIMLADLWFSRLPYWLLHFPAPLAFLCAYVLFAGIYYAVGGKAPERKDYIYPWLDFGRLGVTIPIIFVVVFVIFPVVHASLWAFERKARQRALRGQARAKTRRGDMEKMKKKKKKTTMVAAPDEEEACLDLDNNEDQDVNKEEDEEEQADRHRGGKSGLAPRWPWDRSSSSSSSTNRRHASHRGYIRSVTDDELRRLREELLIGEVEEKEAEAEEKGERGGGQGWAHPHHYEDAETF